MSGIVPMGYNFRRIEWYASGRNQKNAGCRGASDSPSKQETGESRIWVAEGDQVAVVAGIKAPIICIPSCGDESSALQRIHTFVLYVPGMMTTSGTDLWDTWNA